MKYTKPIAEIVELEALSPVMFLLSFEDIVTEDDGDDRLPIVTIYN